MQEALEVYPIRDAEIRLGQFMKLANLVETGGMAKEALAAEVVHVNGEVDTRRGRVLRDGDQVLIMDPETGAGIGAEVGANGRHKPLNADPNANNAATEGDEDDDLGEYFDEATADDGFDPEKWRNL